MSINKDLRIWLNKVLFKAYLEWYKDNIKTYNFVFINLFEITGICDENLNNKGGITNNLKLGLE